MPKVARKVAENRKSCGDSEKPRFLSRNRDRNFRESLTVTVRVRRVTKANGDFTFSNFIYNLLLEIDRFTLNVISASAVLLVTAVTML